MKTNAQKILTQPIAMWPQAINSTRGTVVGALQDVETELSSLIQRAALLHAYISHRYTSGCGDQGHEDSAKHANRELIKIRKAMGFSYPTNTPISIQ